jgi:hypothetical protein
MWSDGIASNLVDETPSTAVGERVASIAWTPGGTHTMTLTISSGTVIVDGIAVVMG